LDANTVSLVLLVLTPILIALAVAALFWLTRRWRWQVEEALKLCADDLDAARGQIFDLREAQVEFAGMHRQPYADMSQELLNLIGEAEASTAALEKAWQELDARKTAAPGEKLRALIVAAPDAYRLARAVDELERLRDELAGRLAQGAAAVQALQAVPSEVAAQASQAIEGIAQLEALLDELHEVGLHGRMMDEADEALLRLQRDQVRFPSGFNGVGVAKATHLAASDLYDLLRNIQPLLGDWMPRVRSWQRMYLRGVETYDRLQKTSANFRAALAAPPPVLIVTRFQAALLQVAATAAELNERLRSAEVQSLRGLEREINHLERILQEAAEQYDQAVQQVAELDHLLLELEADFKLLASRMAEAEVEEDYPLNWDVTEPLKIELQEKIAGLGGRDLKRSPEQVGEALEQGHELFERLTTLLERTDGQIDRYRDLLSLLTSANLAEGAEWARRALQLTREVTAYDPANWNKTDEISGAARDVNALDELQRKLVPAEHPALLRESGLGRRLEETRALAGLHQRLRPRVEHIRARLSELRQLDRDAHDDLDRLVNTLEQTGLLLNGNSYLQEVAAVELSKLRGEAVRLREDFDRPEVGLLEKKAARFKTLSDTAARAMTGWIDRLAANMQLHTAAISESLAGLDGLAQLEDREVHDARELLRRVGAAPAYARPANPLEAAATLKRCAADWQSAAACAAALEQFTAPVLSAARDAEQARRSAKSVLVSAPKLTSGRREWPPSRAALEHDAAEFRKLEARLDGLRGQRWSASRLVRELGLIYHDLDKLDDRAAQAVRAAEGERRAAQEAEQTLGDLIRRLEIFAQRHADQPGVADTALDLARQAEQRLAYLRSRYRQGGVDYDQVLEEMVELAGSLRSARFTSSDGRSIGLES